MLRDKIYIENIIIIILLLIILDVLPLHDITKLK
jgi:hypothetical protein